MIWGPVTSFISSLISLHITQSSQVTLAFFLFAIPWHSSLDTLLACSFTLQCFLKYHLLNMSSLCHPSNNTRYSCPCLFSSQHLPVGVLYLIIYVIVFSVSPYWNVNSMRAEILSVLYIAISQNSEQSLTRQS